MKSIYWSGLVMGSCCVFAVARAATFNTIFNNVEQGPNSHSSPTLIVHDGKRVKTSDGEKETTLLPSEQATTVQTTPKNEAEPAPSDPALSSARLPELAEPKARRFQFDVTGFMTGGDSLLSGRPGMAASFSWYPWRYFGVRGFSGLLFGESFMSGFRGDVLAENALGRSRFVLGAEAEVVPLHLDLFGIDDWLSIGAFGGVSTLGYRSSDPFSMAHAGGRARLLFGENFGALAQVRFNFQYVAVETGLSWAF